MNDENYAQCPVRASSCVWDFNPIHNVDASVEGEKIIYLYNTMGYLIDVYPFDPMETTIEMEVESLTQGIYIVLLYADSVFVESKLLSVQHP